jgi:hypothetical protein
MIRLLHDPTFAATLRADADRALAGVDVTALERTWLTQAAPAAWRTDPDRPARVLGALVEEYPLTTRLGPDRAAGFFASAEFHDAVQARGSLAVAFGIYLGRDATDLDRDAPDPRVRALAALERAIAEIRRTRVPLRVTTGMRLRLAPEVRVLRVPSGTLDLAAALRTGDPGGTLGAEEEAVLVLRTTPDGDVMLEALEPGLAALLERADPGATHDDLRAVARHHGADPGEDQDILDRLIADGLLVGADDSDV